MLLNIVCQSNLMFLMHQYEVIIQDVTFTRLWANIDEVVKDNLYKSKRRWPENVDTVDSAGRIHLADLHHGSS